MGSGVESEKKRHLRIEVDHFEVGPIEWRNLVDDYLASWGSYQRSQSGNWYPLKVTKDGEFVEVSARVRKIGEAWTPQTVNGCRSVALTYSRRAHSQRGDEAYPTRATLSLAMGYAYDEEAGRGSDQPIHYRDLLVAHGWLKMTRPPLSGIRQAPTYRLTVPIGLVSWLDSQGEGRGADMKRLIGRLRAFRDRVRES